jgi:HEPN domain-containing protein
VIVAKNAEEWFRQSDYDLATAKTMRAGGRNFYAVFMCHMAVEKALKAVLFSNKNEVPPKTHNLLWLLKNTGVQAPDAIGKFISKLGEANTATRYPYELEELVRLYNDTVTDDIIKKTGETLAWIKTTR